MPALYVLGMIAAPMAQASCKQAELAVCRPTRGCKLAQRTQSAHDLPCVCVADAYIKQVHTFFCCGLCAACFGTSCCDDRDVRYCDVVVGFGAAKHLAAQGLDVTLLDASPNPGGLSAGWRTKQGRAVEAGVKGFWFQYANIFSLVAELGIEWCAPLSLQSAPRPLAA